MGDMKAKFAKIVGSIIVLLGLGSICIVSVRAQKTGRDSSPSIVTTNWVGYLVAGRTDMSDRITSNPSPTVIRQVEIGLRSDGVVIWREMTKAK